MFCSASVSQTGVLIRQFKISRKHFYLHCKENPTCKFLRQLRCFGPVSLTNSRQNNNFLLFHFQLQQLLQSSCPRFWVFARFMEEHSSLLRGTGSAEETNEDIFGPSHNCLAANEPVQTRRNFNLC